MTAQSTRTAEQPEAACVEAGPREPLRHSLIRYSPALFALVILVADSVQMGDPDLWWHLRSGQAVLASGHLVWRDPYSYWAFGHPWRNHEWLGEILMALAYNYLGVVGLKIWKFSCAAATIAFMSAGMAETGASPAVQLNLLTIAALAMMQQIQFRPQLYTYAMFAAILALLARHDYRGRAPLWIAIPIFALWGNLHGGFIVGLAAIGIYAIVLSIEDAVSGRGFGRAAGVGMAGCGALLATLITPYGVGNWLQVLHTLNNEWNRIAIVEWQPLWVAMAHQWHTSVLGEFNYVLALGLIAATAIGFMLTPKGGDLPMVAIAAAISVAAFMAARNIPLAAIACVIPAARHISILLARADAQAEPGSIRAGGRAHSNVNPWLAGGIVVVLAAYVGVFSPHLDLGMPVPAGAVAFMRQHRLQGNVLNDYDWGGYLIWHIGPGSKDFIDGRGETVFSDKVLNDYITFYFDRPGAREVLNEYPHDFVLIAPDARANALLEHDAEWKLIYRDKTAALFARSNSPAAKIAGAPVEGVAGKSGFFPG